MPEEAGACVGNEGQAWLAIIIPIEHEGNPVSGWEPSLGGSNLWQLGVDACHQLSAPFGRLYRALAVFDRGSDLLPCVLRLGFRDGVHHVIDLVGLPRDGVCILFLFCWIVHFQGSYLLFNVALAWPE